MVSVKRVSAAHLKLYFASGKEGRGSKQKKKKKKGAPVGFRSLSCCPQRAQVDFHYGNLNDVIQLVPVLMPSCILL